MKKYSKVFQILSLILAITFIFTGCGTAGNGDETTQVSQQAQTENTGNVVTPTGNNLNSVDVTAATQGTTQGATQSTTSTGTTSTTQGTTGTTVSTTVIDTTVQNTEPVTEENLSLNDIKEMPLKDVQDLLFATKDPNTAGKILTACGFAYDHEQGIYYSTKDPLQRKFGYNVIFDMVAPQAAMIFSTERIFFNYGDKDWMIQLWKGQYGITAGAEIGLYNKTDKIMQYDCASDDELIDMAFDFYNQGQYVFSRGPEEHWWLTGFKIFNVGVPILIELDITLTFPNVSMADAFERGLKKTVGTALIDTMTYTRQGRSFSIQW